MAVRTYGKGFSVAVPFVVGSSSGIMANRPLVGSAVGGTEALTGPDGFLT